MGGGFWDGGMDNPATMGLLGAGLGMLQGSAPKPGGATFGEALGGGMGGLLGGMMMGRRLQSRGGEPDKFAGLLGGPTPGQTGQPPAAGNPPAPAMQGPQGALMPPTSAAPASSPAMAGAPRVAYAPLPAGMGSDPYGGGRRISVGAPAPQRPRLTQYYIPQIPVHGNGPYGMAYGV